MGAGKSRSYTIQQGFVDGGGSSYNGDKNGMKNGGAVESAARNGVRAADSQQINPRMPDVHVVSGDEAVSRTLLRIVASRADQAIAQRAVFHIAVSGGSVPKFLFDGLADFRTDWSAWRIYFADERLVPFDDPDSTYRLYHEGFKGKADLSDEQIVKINPSLSVDAAAEDYTEKIAAHFPDKDLPEFDLILLGMGPDGHTCSLFPGHRLLNEKSLWVAPIRDSPKPPPNRVTLTLPVVNNAAQVVFVCTGEGKADTVKRVLEEQETSPLPAALIKPTHGELIWILDQPAASKLTKQYN